MGYKLNSLIKLAGMGLNTPVFESIEDADDLFKYEKQFKAWDKVSIRCDFSFKKKGFKLPFYPNKTWTEAMDIINKIFQSRKDLIVIASKGIDPKDSIVAGKYLVADNDEFIECFVGPGTIRDMESDLVERLNIGLYGHRAFPVDQCPLPMIPYAHVFQRMRANAKSLDLSTGFVLEWSLYPYKIGMKSERMIYWEIINL